MKQKINFVYALLFLNFLFLCCSSTTPYHWKKSINGEVYIWTDEIKEFEWVGEKKGDFAHGNGTVNYYQNGKKLGHKKLTLFFGAEKKHYSKLGSTDNLYVGEFKKNGSIQTPNGRGVFLRFDGKVYAGNFFDGKIIEGCHFVDNELRYCGSFFENKYSGFGTYYRNGKKIYSGCWNDGKQSGEGTEYQDNAEFKGVYNEGKRNGKFQIERNGTIRVVAFVDNIPDLTHCKVYYNDGTMWEGPLTEYYEPTGNGKTITSDGLVNFENRFDGELTGNQKITFSDGSFYEGEVKNGRRNGYGVQIYSTGVKYSGDWENDLQNGYGDLDVDENWFYSGEWKNGLYDGEGYFSFPDFSYEGEWKEGKKNGFGTLTLANLQYEGNWKNDSINGEGYISYSDGSYYDGSWQNNKRNGYGEYVWADGSSYYGQWTDDFPNVEGEINLPNGDFYTGEIEYGYFSGAGTYVFANGDRYEGTFVENKKEGIGYYYFANGNSYEGEFKNNQPNGKGKFYFNDGIYYEGEFSNGTIHGKGSLFIPEDSDYTIITADNWHNNDIPKYGSVLFSNGDEFVGELYNGAPSENGIWSTREERVGNKAFSEKLSDFRKSASEKVLTPILSPIISFTNKVNDIAAKGGEKIADGVDFVSDVLPTDNPAYQKAVSFYKKHSIAINKISSATEIVITGINIASTVVGALCPVPQVKVVAKAIDVTCDVVSVSLSASHIIMESVVLASDINNVKKSNGSESEIENLKKQFGQNIAGDITNVSINLGLTTIQKISDGVKAKKALKIYPELKNAQKALEKADEIVEVAKSGKFSDRLIRGTVSIAYGKVGKKLIEVYGDDAAKFLFKYGDNALYALTDGGEAVLKIIEKGNEKAIKAIFDNGESAIKILSKNIDNLDAVAELIAKKGKAGIKFLNDLGDNAGKFSKLYSNSKNPDLLFRLTQKAGKKRRIVLLTLVENNSDDLIEILNKTPKTKFKGTIDYLTVVGVQGVDNLRKNAGNLPSHLLDTPILEDSKKIQFLREAIAGSAKNKNTGDVIQYVLPPNHINEGTKTLKPNVVYMTNANTYDEFGKVINNKAYFGGRYYYMTDEFGRVVEVQTENMISKFSVGRTKRIEYYEKNPLGKIKGVDDAGHDIADSLNGSPFFDNIFAQNGKINRGKNSPWYSKMEKEIREALENGSNVKLHIRHVYEGTEIRTKQYIVEYIIDGDVQSFVVDNLEYLKEF